MKLRLQDGKGLRRQLVVPGKGSPVTVTAEPADFPDDVAKALLGAYPEFVEMVNRKPEGKVKEDGN